MKMPNITPGPWEAEDLPHALLITTESPNKTKYGSSRYAAIGGFDRNDPKQFSEALSNATAIAALPDVLEALIEIVNAADGDGWAELDAGFTKARAALLKAGCTE